SDPHPADTSYTRDTATITNRQPLRQDNFKVSNRQTLDSYTARNRRFTYQEGSKQDAPRSRFSDASVKAAPAPRPPIPPAPFGDLSRATLEEIRHIAAATL
ncbi:hypothetical protein, partial [Streptomyces sp. NPDC058623]|uniref:hypothetical protein n=1 Tax=Streptomyces sp. NPDC058623 TaxID=3346563 RepID=UPI00364979BC